ncbi:MAG: heavy-metal-associated domain-containing protein [Waterburya sp.]
MTIEFKVPDMACGACSESITKAILAIDAQASVKADPETKQVTVETQASESSIKEAIASAGYNPT